MRTSILTSASFFALTLASPNLPKRQDSVDSAALASTLSSIEAEISSVPTAVQAEIEGIPSSVESAFTDPTSLAIIYSQIQAGQLPDWYSTLPPDAQSYIKGSIPKIETILSLEASAFPTNVIISPQTTSSTGAAPTATGTGSTVAAPGNGSSTTAKPTASAGGSGSGSGNSSKTGSSSSAGSSSSSKAGAQPTGVIAAGVLGAVGFVGLALL